MAKSVACRTMILASQSPKVTDQERAEHSPPRSTAVRTYSGVLRLRLDFQSVNAGSVPGKREYVRAVRVSRLAP